MRDIALIYILALLDLKSFHSGKTRISKMYIYGTALGTTTPPPRGWSWFPAPPPVGRRQTWKAHSPMMGQ